MRIYIVRHGETQKNRQKLLQGRSDAPLNESGEQQARTVRDYFGEKGVHFDKVYSSPLSRCVRTAEIIAGEAAKGNVSEDADDIVRADAKGIAGEGRQILTDELLLEMDYGPYEGTSLETPAPEIITFFSDFVNNPAPEGMESLDHVTERLGEFLRNITDQDALKELSLHSNKETKNASILVVTHAIAMKGALEYLTPESEGSYWSKYIGNCAVYETDFLGGVFSVPKEILSLGYKPGV